MNRRRIITDLLRREKNVAFDWATSHCIDWCAITAEAITGRDPIAHLRGLYDSETGVKRVMVENGWKTLADVAASLYREIPVSRAQTGDWARVYNEDGTEGMGVVLGHQIVARAQTGIGIVPLTRADRAYRVE